MNARFSLLALSLMTLPAMAQLSDNTGISGELSLSTGFVSGRSNFNTNGDETITNTFDKASSDSGAILLPLGNVAYTFGANLDKQIYAGTSREDIAVGNLALELGYKQELDSGMVVDLSILPTIMAGETWENPYQVNVVRKTTDESGNAFRVKLSNIIGSNFDLDMAYATKEIDNEKTGINALERDSETLYMKSGYMFTINSTSFIKPSLTYVKTEADGKANSFDGITGEISYFKILDRHQIALTASYTDRSFDATNPIYNRTRNEEEVSLFAAYEYREFMDWQDWSLVSFAGYGKTDSNIDFYDEDQFIFTVGMNYQF
ncbi:DUF2860 domain-containing protein [Vibrio maerlii]|uniref:DUF2860 domain-containing protein n=1 Tax=Vibrio maerlii TaxID=2231648 RepID=UPI000E3CD069|nr:DUF2860 domain-containing protein [Vibrio maerlii]